MVALGDSLVPLLAPHYSDDKITCIFAPDPYPMPLLPMPPPSARHNTEPLFLPDRDSVEPPAPSVSMPLLESSQSARQTCQTLMVRLPPSPDPPAAGSLAAELAADIAHQATEKERDAQRLAEFIKTNTDPSGRGCHASAKEKQKEKRSSQSAKENKSDSKSKSLPCCSNRSSMLILPVSPTVDVSKLAKTPEGLAIWPPLPAAAAAPQIPNEVCVVFTFAPTLSLLIFPPPVSL